MRKDHLIEGLWSSVTENEKNLKTRELSRWVILRDTVPHKCATACKRISCAGTPFSQLILQVGNMAPRHAYARATCAMNVITGFE